MKSHYPPTSDFSCVYLVPQFNDWSGGKVQGVQLVTSHRLSANLLPQNWKFTSLWFPIFDSGKVGRNKLAWCYMSVLSCYCAVLVSPRVAWSSQNRLWVSKTGWDTPAKPHPNAQNLRGSNCGPMTVLLLFSRFIIFICEVFVTNAKCLSRFLTSCHFSRQLTSERSQSRSSSPRSFSFGSGSLFRLKRVPQFEPHVSQAKDAQGCWSLGASGLGASQHISGSQ